MISAAMVLGLVLATTGCDAKEAPPGGADAACAQFETFRMYYGNPLSGIDVLELERSGVATYWATERLERDGVRQRLVHEHHFVVTADVVAALRETLDRIGFCGLEELYPSDIHDGLQASFSVWSRGRRKRVYCDNNFPAPVRELRRFLIARVLPPEADWKRAPAPEGSAFMDAIRRAE